MKSDHQCKVEKFMLAAGQSVPPVITVPSERVRFLRAKLILEEALETIDALGIDILLDDARLTYDCLEFALGGEFNMEEVIDGCCDLGVVTTGTLSACGVPDEPFQFEVNINNLRKLTYSTTVREDGKLVKGENFPKPRIKELLERFGYVK